MRIYTLSVDRESSIYLAVSTEDPKIMGKSYTSCEEAIGKLVSNNPNIKIDEVINLDEVEEAIKRAKKEKP